jgi:cbb3-type cytochrome oxidase maturation protein
MDILFLLVPLSVVLVLVILGLFAWALYSGQFDNVEREGERILWDDTPPAARTVDADQAMAAPRPEQ